MFWEVKSQEPTFLTKSGRPDQFYPRTQVHSPHPRTQVRSQLLPHPRTQVRSQLLPSAYRSALALKDQR